MNNAYLGSSLTVTSIDLCFQMSKAFELPMLYISMITQPRERNRGDKNATNYRIGNNNKALRDLMKQLYYSETSSITDVFEYLMSVKIDLKAIASRNNAKANHYRMGATSYFTHKQRGEYFSELYKHISQIDELIYLEPDNGIIQPTKKLKQSNGDMFVSLNELKVILDTATGSSIVIVRQMMNMDIPLKESTKFRGYVIT
jgi:hypothetical protein